MDIVLDACSIINLINGGCIEQALSLDHTFYTGEAVLEGEILNPIQKAIVEAYIEEGKLATLQSTIALSELIELRAKYNLGLGETECMALCKTKGYAICTDDKKARHCSSAELGTDNVIGSLYLLRESVLNFLVECLQALASYRLMKEMGGFLPKKLDEKYFCQA